MNNKLIENVVSNLSKLQGIGKKSAERIAYQLCMSDKANEYSISMSLAKSLLEMIEHLGACNKCLNMIDKRENNHTCTICSDVNRNSKELCIVLDYKDMSYIEGLEIYGGYYFCIGNLINPYQGVGVDMLPINHLIDIVEERKSEEIIMALPFNQEGEITMQYLSKILSNKVEKITILHKGIPFGYELGWVDAYTLKNSFLNRTSLC